MARRRPRFQLEQALADDLHGFRGNRGQLAPETVELVPVEPAGAPLEPAWIEEMRRPDLAHMHSQLRIPAGQDAGRARMVQVDVRQHEVTEILEREAVPAQRSLERPKAAARAAVDEHRLVAGEQVRADDPRAPEVQEVEKLRTTS